MGSEIEVWCADRVHEREGCPVGRRQRKSIQGKSRVVPAGIGWVR